MKTAFTNISFFRCF